jgi:hypothetical protein
MTIENVTPLIQYTGNGVQVSFTAPFKLFADADVAVYLGTEKQTSGFTVALVNSGNDGATVTFATAPAIGGLVTLQREVIYQRGTDYQQAGLFQASTINADFDALVAMVQQLARDISRCFQLPVTSSGALALPSVVARRALLWDALGNLINSASDPDETAAAATTALFTALTANATADAAAATAAEALASNNNFGVAPRFGSGSLVQGVTTYDTLLAADDPVGSVGHFEVIYGGAPLIPGTDFTLAPNGRGVVFAATVLAAGSVPGAGEMVAEETFFWRASPSLRSLDIGAGVVGATQLASGAVDLGGDKVVAGTANRLLVRGSGGTVAERAYPAEGKALGGGAGGTSLVDLTLPAAASNEDVSGRTGTGYVTAGQLPLTDLVAATIIYDAVTPAVIHATAGFTLTRPATGQIKITFPAAYSSPDGYVPMLQVGVASGNGIVSKVLEQLADSVTFETRRGDGNALNLTRAHILIVRVK